MLKKIIVISLITLLPFSLAIASSVDNDFTQYEKQSEKLSKELRNLESFNMTLQQKEQKSAALNNADSLNTTANTKNDELQNPLSDKESTQAVQKTTKSKSTAGTSSTSGSTNYTAKTGQIHSPVADQPKENQPTKEEVKKEASSNTDNSQTQAPDNGTSTPVTSGDWAIDDSKANSGTVSAKGTSDKKLKVMIVKDSSKNTFDLSGNNKYQSYPLQAGDGTYKVSILENVSGTTYKTKYSKNVTMKTSSPNDKYLTSVQMISWNTSMAPIKKAQSLASGKSDANKVAAIYSYVKNNINYDSSITSLPSGYVPSIERTYSSRKGICYDFASLTAAMLRSVGVPTKLVKGTSDNVSGYHAWNEVYVNGSWHIIDTSYDSQARAAGVGVSMYKSGGYHGQKTY